MNDEKYKFIMTLVGIVLFLVIICVIVAQADVYGLQAGKEGKLPIVTNYNKSTAALWRTLDYDAVILGSSMSMNMRCSIFDELFKCQSMKFALSDSPPKETAYLWEHIAAQRPLKYVLIDICPAFFFYNETYEIRLPEKIMETGSFPCQHYVSFDELKQALIKIYKTYIRNSKRDYVSRDDWNAWYLYIPCGKKHLARNLTNWSFELPEYSQGKKNIEKNLCEHIGKLIGRYPDTQVILFFPPYSIFFYESIDIMLYLSLKRYIAEQSFKYKNLMLFDFQFATLIFNHENFRDPVHYSREINDWIIQECAKLNYKLTPNTLDSFLQSLEQNVLNYDYKQARDELSRTLFQQTVP